MIRRLAKIAIITLALTLLSTCIVSEYALNLRTTIEEAR